MAAPATAALVAIGAAAKQSIDAASDLQEAQSKNAVIFGKQAGGIEAFAKKAATALGQSRVQALDAASTFGLIGQKAGLGGRETAAFAKQFTTLASDLASFNNTSPEEAITAIGAAMRGEAEPIRRYGVLLDDMTLRQEAMRLGLVKNVKTALTPQQKALAASEAIMRQTTKAQGDFARTSDGAANKQRIVTAQVENLKAKLGVQLLPVYQKVLGVISRVVDWFSKHQTVAKVLVGALALLAVSIIAVNIAMLANPASLVVAGLVAIGVGLVAAYRKSETFRNVVNSVAGFIRSDVVPALQAFGRYLTGTVLPAVVATGRRVASNLRPVLTQAGKTIRNDVIPAARQVAAKFREWWPTIRRVLEVIGRLITKLVEFNSKVVSKVLPVIIKAAGFLISKLVPAGLNTASMFVKMIVKVVEFGRKIVAAVQAVGRFVSGVKSKIGEAVTTVAGLPGKAIGALGDLSTRLLQSGRQLIDGLINGVKEKAGELASAAVDAVGGAINAARNKLGISSPSKVFALIGVQTIRGLVVGLRRGSPAAERIMERLSNRLSKKAVKTLRNEFNAMRRNARVQDLINKRLTAALARLKSLRAASAQYAASIRDSIVTSGSITSLGEGTGFGSFDQLASNLTDRLRRAREYASALKQLAARGLNKTTLQQLIDAGVDGGLGTAQTLLAGGRSGIRQINQLTRDIARTGKGLGDEMAKRFHGAGIRAAQGLVSGLRERQKDLDRIARRMALTLVRAVRAALKIKSPSRVFRDLGRQTIAGLEIGLDAAPVKRAGVQLADALAGGFGTPSLAAVGDVSAARGGNTYSIKVEVAPGANPVEVGRQVVKAIDAYERAGGRRAS